MEPQVQNGKLSEAMRVGSNIIYDKKVFDSMVDQSARGNAAQTLSATVVLVLQKIEEKLGKLEMDDLFAVGMALIVDVADAFTEMGMEINEEVVTESLSTAVTTFLQQNPGRWNEQELREGMGRLEQTAMEMEDPEAAGAGAAAGGMPQAPQQGLLPEMNNG